MKLVILMYLEEDQVEVRKLLGRHQVAAYSELPVEGHSDGVGGWHGRVAPYASRMVLAFTSASKAEALLASVSTCTGCQDASHPIHAWQIDVEGAVSSGLPAPNADA